MATLLARADAVQKRHQCIELALRDLHGDCLGYGHLPRGKVDYQLFACRALGPHKSGNDFWASMTPADRPRRTAPVAGSGYAISEQMAKYFNTAIPFYEVSRLMPPTCFRCKNAGNWAGVREDLQQLLRSDWHAFLRA